MTAARLVLQGVDKRFGTVSVLRAVDLCLEPGTRTWLSGANGAGKSTLLDLVCGAQTPDAGTIRLDGQRLDGLDMPARFRHGMVRTWQLPSIFAGHRVCDQLAAAWRLRQAPRSALSLRRPGPAADDAAEQLARRWGLADKLTAMPAALSHAQRRLLDLALAFAGPARLVLLDEPSAGLSRRDAAELFERLDEQTRTSTVLIVEHDHRLASAFAQIAYVLRDGRVQADA